MELSCTPCSLSPEDAMEPAFSVVGGMAVCEKHLEQVAKSIIDGYSQAAILSDAVTGNL